MADKEGTRLTSEAIVMCQAPCVCKTPSGPSMVPVPYQILAMFDKAVNTSIRTNFGGKPAFHAQSFISTVTGNQPGVGGGMVSNVNVGTARPTKWSMTVRVEKNWVVRHDELMLMNCAGPKGTSNTMGKVVYVKIVQMAKVNEDGTIEVQKKGAYTDSEGNRGVFEQTEVRDLEGNVLDTRTTITAETGGNALPSAEFGDVGPQSPLQLDIEEPELPGLQPLSTSTPQPTNPPAVPTPAEKGVWASVSPWVHGGLDVVGLVPVFGEFADGVNTVIYLGEENYTDAALSAGAMIPIAGWAAAGGKVVRRLGKYGDKIVDGVKAGADFVKRHGQRATEAGRRLASSVAKRVDDAVNGFKKKFGKKKNTKDPGGSGNSSGGNGKDGTTVTGGPSRTQPTGQKGGKPDGEKSPETGSQRHKHMRENEAAETLADQGYKVEQNPGTLPNGKNPDYKIEGEYFDCYTPHSGNIDQVRKGISDKVSRGQADRIVLNLDDSPFGANDITDLLTRKPKKGLKEVIGVKGGKVTQIFP